MNNETLAQSTEVTNLINFIISKFKSGNEIEVDRITIKRSDLPQSIRDMINEQ